ncbi:MAG: hypothetical protein GZ091_07395 [Paludibacter sp.]|nr:hypothetical protein [Paludibacter sp.]
MKTKNRFIKAFAVIIVVGIGMVYNMHLKINVIDFSPSGLTITEENQVKIDTLDANNNKFYIYSTSVIRSGIEHLISNL